MVDALPQFSAIIPELVTAGMICAALMTDLFLRHRTQYAGYVLVQLALVFVAVWTLINLWAPQAEVFNNLLIIDQLSRLMKLFIAVVAFGVFWYSRQYVVQQNMPVGEYYVLGLCSVLGMMILVSSYHFMTLFMGLELFSLPVYAMVALNRDSKVSTEAAMKYFVIGAMGSGMLLYGLSMLYGATQTLQMSEAANAISSTAAANDLILVFALVFVLAGVAFKLGAVPFHMWVPDVYDGSPNSVTLFISTAPKIAALGMAFRLLTTAMPDLAEQWQAILIVLSIASMATGNLLAIAQSSIKRMLAYSSIAHIGYTLLGVIAVTQEGYGSALFYLLTYVFMTAAAFGILTLLSREGYEVQWIEDLQGLSERNPWLAFMMLLVMFSMAGIPPLVGFMAKVAVLEALISVNLIWLAALALVFAIVGAYYYIRVVKVMYFEQSQTKEPLECPVDLKALASVNCLALLILGLFPGGLFHLCHAVI